MAFEKTEELVVGLYDVGEIVYIKPPDSSVEVKDPSYPEEVFKELKSGRMSPHYVAGRDFTAFSRNLPVPIPRQKRIRDLAVEGYCGLLNSQKYDHLLGIPEAMTCMSGLVAQARGKSVLWMRVGEKSYGVHKAIQGHFAKEDSVAALDNVITDGASKIETVETLEPAGLKVASFNVLIEREEGGREEMETAGYPLLAVVGMRAVTRILAENKRITAEQQRWADMYHEKMASL